MSLQYCFALWLTVTVTSASGPCPPNARMDMFIALDSSSSVGVSNWVLMTEFVKEILQSFTVSWDRSLFSVVRYNRRVDAASQITLNDHPNDKQGLLDAFDRIPYDGAGTMTGRVIRYAGDELMTVASGDRPDVRNVLMVITDGRSRDDVLEPSQALRQRGVMIFAVGIRPARGILDEHQLVEIAGSRNNVLIANNFTGLNTDFAHRIIARVCDNSCRY